MDAQGRWSKLSLHLRPYHASASPSRRSSLDFAPSRSSIPISEDGRENLAGRQPTKQDWLLARHSEWKDSHQLRTKLEAQRPRDAILPALPSDREFEEQLKRAWLRRFKEDRDIVVSVREERFDLKQDGKAAEPSHREVWLQQKRRERELAVRERSREEQEAESKPALSQDTKEPTSQEIADSQKKQVCHTGWQRMCAWSLHWNALAPDFACLLYV